ncbi:MAG: hypothetical protein ACYC6G_17160 [Desulfobaccales bacterium]
MGILSGKTYDPAAGRDSRSAFIAQSAFWLAAGKFLANGVTIRLWGHLLNLGTVDAALLGAFLIPCLALYWGRRSLSFGPKVDAPPDPMRVPDGGSGTVG